MDRIFTLPPPPTYSHQVLSCPNYDTLITIFKGPNDVLKEVHTNTCAECNSFGFSYSLWLCNNRITHICRLCTSIYARRPDVYPALHAAHHEFYGAKYQFALSLYKFYKVYDYGPHPEYLKALEDAQHVFNTQILRTTSSQ